MINISRIFKKLLLVSAAVFSLGLIGNQASAATAEELNKDASAALQTLYRTNPVAADIGKNAKAILVFPHILKAGLVFGGSYGEGVLIKNSQFAGYYNSVSASWGWQAGVESYGYVVFLMNEKAERYLEKTQGWEVGVGPGIVVVNSGIAKNLSTTTLKSDAYAVIFDQQGLMVDISIEGTKISHIRR